MHSLMTKITVKGSNHLEGDYKLLLSGISTCGNNKSENLQMFWRECTGFFCYVCDGSASRKRHNCPCRQRGWVQGWETNSNVGNDESASRTKNQNTDQKKVLG